MCTQHTGAGRPCAQTGHCSEHSLSTSYGSNTTPWPLKVWSVGHITRSRSGPHLAATGNLHWQASLVCVASNKHYAESLTSVIPRHPPNTSQRQALILLTAAKRSSDLVKVSQVPRAGAATGSQIVGRLQSLSSQAHITTPAAFPVGSPQPLGQRARTPHCTDKALEAGEARPPALRLSRGGVRPGAHPVCWAMPAFLPSWAHWSSAQSQSTGPGWGSRLQSQQALQTQWGAGSGKWGGGTGSSVWSEDILLHSQTQFCVPFEKKQRIAGLSPKKLASFNIPVAAISNYNFRGLL